MGVTRGDIVDYDVPDTDPSVSGSAISSGETVPLLVVSADDNGYSGFAFLPTGVTNYVTVENVQDAPPAPTEPTPAPVASDPEPTPAPKPRGLFDAQTGQPVPTDSPAPKFDEYTGELLTPNETPKFDPYTGQPLDGPDTTSPVVPGLPTSDLPPASAPGAATFQAPVSAPAPTQEA